MSVLVTGATGFIGGHLARRLVSDGRHVRALARPGSDTRTLESLGCDIVAGDLRHADSLQRAVEGMDLVFHAGAAMSGEWNVFNDVTVRGTERLLAASLEAGVRRFIHISSISVYRLIDLPNNAVLDESSPVEHEAQRVGSYARSKVAAEALVAAYHGRGLPTVVVRPGLVFGPNGKVFWPNIGYLRGNTCLIMGSPASLLPLTYVENTVDGISLAGSAPGVDGETYHLADGPGISKRDYMRGYMRETGARLAIVPVPFLALGGLGLVSDVVARLGAKAPLPSRHGLLTKYRGLRLDTSRAERDLGWRPRVSLEEGLRRTFAWYGRSGDRSHEETAPPALARELQ